MFSWSPLLTYVILALKSPYWHAVASFSSLLPGHLRSSVLFELPANKLIPVAEKSARLIGVKLID